MLTDSSGRRVGYDPVEGKVNDFLDPETNFSGYYDSSSDDNQIFMVPFLEWGKTITITITGVDNGEYSLFTFFYDLHGDANYFFEDTITVGEVQTVTVDIYNNTLEFPRAPEVQAEPDKLASVGQSITFEGSFVDKNPDDTHQITWDFGDGNGIDDTLNPVHTYTNPGIYTVTLTVVDSVGFSISDSLIVTVE